MKTVYEVIEEYKLGLCSITDGMNNKPNTCLLFSKDGHLCTRPKGHEGKHHAHGPDNECYEIWKA